MKVLSPHVGFETIQRCALLVEMQWRIVVPDMVVGQSWEVQ
jgi:hypothetical protein